MIHSMRLGWILVALACSQALPAAEPDDATPYHYGIRFLAATPRQDFRVLDSRTGYGGGLFVEAPTGSGWIAQTRFDYLTFRQVNQPNAKAIAAYTVPSPLTLAVDSAELGVDLRHALPVAGLERCYGLVGASAIRYEFETSGPNTTVNQNGIPFTGIVRYKDKTPIGLGLALGVGVEIWRGLALTERYTTADIDGTTFATWETSLSYRF